MSLILRLCLKLLYTSLLQLQQQQANPSTKTGGLFKVARSNFCSPSPAHWDFANFKQTHKQAERKALQCSSPAAGCAPDLMGNDGHIGLSAFVSPKTLWGWGEAEPECKRASFSVLRQHMGARNS